jgi:hypothetical protein
MILLGQIGSILISYVLLLSSSLYAQQGAFGEAQYIDSIQVPGTASVWQQAADDALISEIIQRAINRVLGILWLIALIILLYGGFLMLTAAGNDEKYNKWFTILKHTAIGLAFIGISRFIVSMVFYLIEIIT